MPCVTALYVPPCCVTQCTSPFPAQDIQVMYIYQSPCFKWDPRGILNIFLYPRPPSPP